MAKNDAILTKMVMICSPVPRISNSAQPQASKPAGRYQTRRIGNCPGPADLEIRGRADSEFRAPARDLGKRRDAPGSPGRRTNFGNPSLRLSPRRRGERGGRQEFIVRPVRHEPPDYCCLLCKLRRYPKGGLFYGWSAEAPPQKMSCK